MDEGSWLSLIVILFLLFSAAYFALIESSFSSVGKIRLKARMDRGDRRAARALYVLDHFERAITTILVGANLVQIIMARSPRFCGPPLGVGSVFRLHRTPPARCSFWGKCTKSVGKNTASALPWLALFAVLFYAHFCTGLAV
jgi:hypothetical protein